MSKSSASLYIALARSALCAALFLGLAVGTASGIVGQTAEPEDAAVALPIIGIAGTRARRLPGGGLAARD